MPHLHLQQSKSRVAAALLAATFLASTNAANAQSVRAHPADPAEKQAVDPAESRPGAGPSGKVRDDNFSPYYGNINPFYGNISPFWGNITPFWGNITPFWGNITPFWGNITPFWGNINPFTSSTQPLAPSWGAIQPFWDDLGAHWETTDGLWSVAETAPLVPLAYDAIAGRLDEMVTLSEATWGNVVASETGTTFRAGFADPLFAEFGIDLDDPSSLAALAPEQRTEFFMAWYDGLMNYSGQDRVDHWMRTVNWTPAITQQQGEGADTVIGLIDADIKGAADLLDNVVYKTGNDSFVGGHGIGVASLMVAAHDGDGVMGIAPMASVVLHNPFDADGTADWMDVRQGIISLKSQNASIINMSLGEPGTVLSSFWNDIFGHASVLERKGDTVYVIAAGNEGLTQTEDIEWGNALGTNFLLVGSVDPIGNISTFSNRPGDACLLDNGTCGNSADLNESGLLMNRFIVAPGELILVADGEGGTVRRTGTSFAAPLVSGAIALLHDRWPWLASHPEASTEIILRSAADLGDPGVDPVYGAGLLDVAASQSPLDFNSLLFYQVENGVITQKTGAGLQTSGVNSTWEANGVYFLLFEDVSDTVRDFVVPMSTLLNGSITTTFGSEEQFQHFLTQRLVDFIGTGESADFTDVSSYTTPAHGGWQMTMAAENPTAYLSDRTGSMPHSSLRAAAPGGRVAFTAGFGSGAMAMTRQRGFGMLSDYATDGGVNPLLGLASGGAFLAADIALTDKTLVTFGATNREVSPENNLALSKLERVSLAGTEDYRAHAVNVRMTHSPASDLSLSLNYTRLHEENALLAVQARNGLLDRGSVSETLTLGGSAGFSGGLTLAASATVGRSATAGDAQLGTDDRGLLTSAFAVSATKDSVLARGDRLRLSFSQPLNIERGTMRFQSAEVIDRQTGEIGVVEKHFDVAQDKRAFSGEILYVAPFNEGGGQVSMFGRITSGSGDDLRSGFVAGTRVRLDF